MDRRKYIGVSGGHGRDAQWAWASFRSDENVACQAGRHKPLTLAVGRGMWI